MAFSVPTLPPERLNTIEAAYRDAVAAKRRRSLLFIAIVAVLIVAAGVSAEINFSKFFANLPKFSNYLGNIMPHLTLANFRGDMAEWYWSLGKWSRLLGETLLMAYLATLFGGLGAFCLSFLASANLIRQPWLRFGTRRLLELFRTVPEIVFALIFVIAFGVGPMAGVLALAIHTMGALGKMFAEVVENIDMKPVEGLTSTGAGWIQVVRFAVVPQVLANFASYGLLRFEINVRGASVMGFVGAGGIGQELMLTIRNFYYSDVSAVLLMIILTVVTIDLATEQLRQRLSGAAR